MRTQEEIKQKILKLSKQLPGYIFPCTKDEEYKTTIARTDILARIAALRWVINERPEVDL